MSGVSEVYSVAGNYDLVAILRAKNNESLADLVSETIRKVPGVVRTETLIGISRVLEARSGDLIQLRLEA